MTTQINDMSLDLSRSISQVIGGATLASPPCPFPKPATTYTAQEDEPPPLLDTAEGGEPADAIKIKIAVKKQACFAPLPVCM